MVHILQFIVHILQFIAVVFIHTRNILALPKSAPHIQYIGPCSTFIRSDCMLDWRYRCMKCAICGLYFPPTCTIPLFISAVWSRWRVKGNRVYGAFPQENSTDQANVIHLQNKTNKIVQLSGTFNSLENDCVFGPPR